MSDQSFHCHFGLKLTETLPSELFPHPPIGLYPWKSETAWRDSRWVLGDYVVEGVSFVVESLNFVQEEPLGQVGK